MGGQEGCQKVCGRYSQARACTYGRFSLSELTFVMPCITFMVSLLLSGGALKGVPMAVFVMFVVFVLVCRMGVVRDSAEGFAVG